MRISEYTKQIEFIARRNSTHVHGDPCLYCRIMTLYDATIESAHFWKAVCLVLVMLFMISKSLSPSSTPSDSQVTDVAGEPPELEYAQEASVDYNAQRIRVLVRK